MHFSFRGNTLWPAVFLALLTLPLQAAQVFKANGAMFIAVDKNGPGWKLDDAVCVFRGGAQLACGKVTKVKGNSALVRITRQEGSALVRAGDEVRHSAADRGLASEESETSVDRTSRSEDFSHWQVGVELLGAGLLYSAIASYRIWPNLAINLGASDISATASSSSGSVSGSGSVSVLQVPISVSYLWGGTNSFLELLG
jgi:hypothetical protein